MANSITFSNKGNQALMAEAGPQNLAMDFREPAYDNAFDGHGTLGLIDSYAMFFPEANIDNKPIYYFRHYDVAKNYYRFGNFMDLGEDVLSPQKGVLHGDQVAGPETSVVRYHKISDDPLCFSYSSSDKLVDYKFYSDHIDIKEGNFLDVTATPLPIAIYDHNSVFQNTGVVFQPLLYKGTMDGKPTVGLGEVERMFFHEDITGFDNVPMGYVCVTGSGIRHDGRIEATLLSIAINPTGKNFAYYFLEGEEPVISDVITMTANWEHLPYVDDGTCVFKDAVFEFGGKKINFLGKWGTKGFQPEPRIERHGQSQAVGSWFEGDEPYEHRLYVGFAESMEAYDKVLTDLGFDVK